MREENRVRLYAVRPTPDQIATLARLERAQRYLWNLALGQYMAWHQRLRGGGPFRARGERPEGYDFDLERSDEWRAGGYFMPDMVEQCRELTPLRALLPFLAEVPRASQAALLKTLEESWTAHFKGLRGVPRFKKPIDPCGFSFAFNPKGTMWKTAPLDDGREGWSTFTMPRVGDVPFREHVPTGGTPVAMRVYRRADRWYVAVTVRVMLPEVAPPEAQRVVGVNRGLVETVGTSDGLVIPGLRAFLETAEALGEVRRTIALRLATWTKDPVTGRESHAHGKASKREMHERTVALRTELHRLRREMVLALLPTLGARAEQVVPSIAMALEPARLARAQVVVAGLYEARKGRQKSAGERLPPSRNETRARMRVASLHAEAADARKTRSHTIAKVLAQGGNVLVFDALDLRRMTKSASGTAETPGRGVGHTAAFNRQMLDSCGGMILTMTTYKAPEYGGVVVSGPPEFNSQRCPVCGLVAEDNHPSATVFHCIGCGHGENANVVMGKNLARNYEAGAVVEKKPKKTIARKLRPKRRARPDSETPSTPTDQSQETPAP